MNQITKKFIGLTFLSLSILTGCASEESAEVESIIEEQGAFSFDLGDSPLLTFQSDGMQIINAHNIPGDYPFPFEPNQLYKEYDIVHTDETLRIEADDLVYELEILGPRLFRDNKNDLELSTHVYLLNEEDQTD
ncbi:MAG: hypothetical protein R6U02_05425 [Alkalibacterium sp.]|uniref:hypothetical protein n=1 Tax=Alkalibacterium sp. TaxID=1872447 RepID=UPI003970A439